MASRVRLNRSSLPSAWSLLGKVLRVEGDSRSWDFSASWFAADPRGGALLIGPDSIAAPLDDYWARTVPGAAVRLREAFTGRARDGRTWELPPLPLDWTDAGKAVSILYESDKRNGGGTGKPELFRHPFDPDARVYVSGPFLSIVGEKLTVDASGVRH
jgi:hypothetical protein